MKNRFVGEGPMAPGLVGLFAVAAGLIVANLYYAQTLVGPIAASLGIAPAAAGLVVTVTQMGYCLGLVFIAPLGDRLENRRMIVTGILFTALAMALAAIAKSGMVFLFAALCVGLGAVVAQVLIPFAAHLSPESTRGQTVGKVVSGVMIGIMLARPVASLIADHGSWELVFGLASLVLAVLAVIVHARLPQRIPQNAPAYPTLIASLWHLLRTTPVLRRRSAYHAALFAAFSLFWTTAPLMLEAPGFGLSQSGIALFALVGMAGAIASPVAGRLADRGHTRAATGLALALAAMAFLMPLFAPASRLAALALMAIAAIVLDMAVAGNLVLGQRAIYMLGADVRTRLNSIYYAFIFAGGAAGSSLGAWVYAHHGMRGAMLAGLAISLLPLAYWMSEFRGGKQGGATSLQAGTGVSIR